MTSLSELCPLPGSAASEIGRHQPFSLRDDVEIRPIRPSDAQALIEGFRRLSPETIRRRFFAPLRELNPEFARRLANVDFVDRAAFVATLPGSDQVVAVGRYDRVGPDTAEVAFVTLDQLQRRGIASRIFRRLLRLARHNGIRRFVATVLPENHAVLRLLRSTGLPMRTSRAGSAVEVMLEIAPPDEAAAASER